MPVRCICPLILIALPLVCHAGPMPDRSPPDLVKVHKALYREFATELATLDRDRVEPVDWSRIPDPPVPIDHWVYDVLWLLGEWAGLPRDLGHVPADPHGWSRHEVTMVATTLLGALDPALPGAEPRVRRYHAALWFHLAGCTWKSPEGSGVGPSPLDDVPEGHPARRAVAALLDAGLLRRGAAFSGNAPLTYREYERWALASMGIAEQDGADWLIGGERLPPDFPRGAEADKAMTPAHFLSALKVLGLR